MENIRKTLTTYFLLKQCAWLTPDTIRKTLGKQKTRFWKTSGKQENRWKTIGKRTENMENKENIEENAWKTSGKQWKTGKRTENKENIEENIDCFVNG